MYDLNRSFYSASLSDFMDEKTASIIGKLSQNHSQDITHQQTNAWVSQIEILKNELACFSYKNNFISFEFSIPRMGKRADIILIADGIIFVIEFKVGSDNFLSSDQNQAIDYALDLKNFHEGSHKKFVIPILIATKASQKIQNINCDKDGVFSLLMGNDRSLQKLIVESLNHISKFCLGNNDLDRVINCNDWLKSSYKPTPTIIQAATALYQGHNVKEISRSDAGSINLSRTSLAIENVINDASQNNNKAICFVTGVPGAGKTLAGLNLTTGQMQEENRSGAVFLSGNGPLVDVMREALARDESNRKKITKTDAERNAKSFIQNIHHFRDGYLRDPNAPHERIVVFDEAQRAWDKNNTSKFMKTKRGQKDFDLSEPEFLIQVMDRHKDWCVIIALIGGGQEINTGEAGLPEWFSALRNNFPHWHVHYSPNIDHQEYTQDKPLNEHLLGLRATSNDSLHLSVSLRSFRAEKVSDFISKVINNQPKAAKESYEKLSKNYPIVMTRNLDTARNWLKSKTRGSELMGLVASSGANRLIPEGLNIKDKISPPQWFLNGKMDVRSCQYLEGVATEYDIQGLELDWAGVCWDADFRYKKNKDEIGSWTYNNFKGTKWQKVPKLERQRYLANSYRVLLTRARQGLIIFIPKGDNEDFTRLCSFYDDTANFLKSCGIKEIS